MKLIPNSIAILALTLSSAASATIIDNGSYTTVNGIDWLDLSSTKAMSVDMALTANSGWRVATKAEFQAMFAEFEVADDGKFFDTVSVSESRDTFWGFTEHVLVNNPLRQNVFADHFGWTYDVGDYFDLSYGFYADGGGYGIGGVYQEDALARTYEGEFNRVFDDLGHQNAGIFMVRAAPVPEPSIIALITLGLAGIGMARRKNKTLRG